MNYTKIFNDFIVKVSPISQSCNCQEADFVCSECEALGQTRIDKINEAVDKNDKIKLVIGNIVFDFWKNNCMDIGNLKQDLKRFKEISNDFWRIIKTYSYNDVDDLIEFLKKNPR